MNITKKILLLLIIFSALFVPNFFSENSAYVNAFVPAEITPLDDLRNENSEIIADLISKDKVSEYVPLSGEIPGLTGGVGEGHGRFAGYLNNMYLWGVSIAVILSIIMIIFGGVQYMTTDSISNKSEGKKRIQGAVVGLILALTSYLILNTINPQLVSLEFGIKATNPGGGVLGGSR